jgi:2-dehydropantoate 2-reductase
MPSGHVLPDYRIVVVGSGAVGGYYGAKLAYMGRDVHFLIRNEEDRAAIRRFGLQIKSREGNLRIAKVRAYSSTEEIGPADLVLIALKATSNEALTALIPPLLKPETVLLTLQNGLGNEEFLAEHFGAGRVLGGLCFVCLNRTTPGVIEHQGYGRVTLGEHGGHPLPRTHDIAWEFKRCGVPTHVAADLATERWRKLVWNIPFNGMTILASAQSGRTITTADLLADDSLSYLTRRLMDEVIATANRLGRPIPADFSALQFKRTAEMGAYHPSSLLDYLAGRPVELEAIWGEAYRHAFNAGIDAGRLETLYYLLRRLTQTTR